MVRAQRAGETEHSYLLLSILMLEVWLQTFVPRAIGVATMAREAITAA